MNNMNRRQLILGGLAATVIVVLPRQSNADMTIGGYIIVASLWGLRRSGTENRVKRSI